MMKLYDVKWTSLHAGPSPLNNRRTEMFFYGCKIAVEGHPCKNCFNPDLWNSKGASSIDKDNVVNSIVGYAPNKYITFVGGEPLDQLHELAYVCSKLKKHGFHIIVFTHYKLKELKRSCDMLVLLNSIDILIDGEYREEERIYDDKAGDGLHNAVGSANQIIWDLRPSTDKEKANIIEGYKAGDLAGIYVKPNDDLVYILKKDIEPERTYLFLKMEGKVA